MHPPESSFPGIAENDPILRPTTNDVVTGASGDAVFEHRSFQARSRQLKQ
jgi:hypothetical protein